MSKNFWKHVLWIKFFSCFVPLCTMAKTVMPDKLVRCFGLVNTRQATNHMLLSSRKPRDCDSHGYILLLEHDCVSVLRGQTIAGPRFGCVNSPCPEELPAESCQVDRQKLLLAQAEVRKRSVKTQQKKPSVMGYQAKGPFGKARQTRAPIISNY